MELNINKAYSFIFKSENWIVKIAIGSIFILLSMVITQVNSYINPIMKMKHHASELSSLPPSSLAVYGALTLVVIILTILLSFFTKGYVLTSIHNQIAGDEEKLLPEWDNKYLEYFKKGGIFYLLSIVFGIIIGLPIGIITGLAIAIAYHGQRNSSMIAIIASIIVTYFAILVIFPFVKTAYAKDFIFKDGLNLKDIVNKIAKVLSKYLIAILLSILTTLALIVSIFILAITCIGIIFMPVVMFIYDLIISNLFAQAYKIAMEKEAV